MRPTAKAALELASHEAIVREAYLDSRGVPTWSIGITRAAGVDVSKFFGNPQPMQDCVDAYAKALNKYAEAVNNTFAGTAMTEAQFAAALSFHYNTGGIRKASWVGEFKAGDMAAARRKFMLWTKNPELVGRRTKEARLLFEGIWSNNGTVPEVTRLKADRTPDFSSLVPRNLEKEFSIAFAANIHSPEAKSMAEQLNAEDLVSKTDADEALTTENLLKSNPASPNLPKSRPGQSAKVTYATLEKFRALLPPGRENDRVFVLGVRGYYTDTLGEPGRNDRGIYDDAMFVIEPGRVHNFNANTDPSRSKKGIANLKARQVVIYKPGLHGISGPNPYPAFRQHSACTVVRDGIGEDTDTITNPFWINLHRGGVNSTSSAGCQTVPPTQWPEFKQLIDRLLAEFKQSSFCYLLVDAADTAIEAIPQPVPQPTPQPAQNLLPVVLALLSLIEKRRKADGKPDAGEFEIIRKIIEELRGPKAAPAEALTPINAALGDAIGKPLNGRKTALGIVGLLATSLVPALFPQSGEAILKAFDLGATDATATAANGKSLLQGVFGALASWGVLGKAEKWVHLFLGRKSG